MSTESKSSEESDKIMDAIEGLKQEKAKLKSAFTRTRHQLLQHFEDEEQSHVISTTSEKLSSIQSAVLDVMIGLSKEYRKIGDHIAVKKTGEEIETIEREYTDAMNAMRKEKKKETEHEIGQDLWRQLKRVSIPVFQGEKKNYESWKAAFVACIDKAPATPEYKLLQLRQYLSGEALKVIENLGHSATAYEAAKGRLERKYGGPRRQIARYLEDLENFRPIRAGKIQELERFADLLDIAVVNLKEAKRYGELGDGSLYNQLQKKLPEVMLAKYHRWVFENKKQESVKTIREYIIQETEFQTIAAETIRGLGMENRRGDCERDRGQYRGERHGNRTFFGNERTTGNSYMYDKLRTKKCSHCDGSHGIWQCEKFKCMDVKDPWRRAQDLSLCYRCLGKDHVGKSCSRSRICGIDNCRAVHSRLLHGKSDGYGRYRQPNQNKENEKEIEIEQSNDSTSKMESSPHGRGARRRNLHYACSTKPK